MLLHASPSNRANRYRLYSHYTHQHTPELLISKVKFFLRILFFPLHYHRRQGVCFVSRLLGHGHSCSGRSTLSTHSTEHESQKVSLPNTNCFHTAFLPSGFSTSVVFTPFAFLLRASSLPSLLTPDILFYSLPQTAFPYFSNTPAIPHLRFTSATSSRLTTFKQLLYYLVDI